jgi:ElaB/YqjD/DUF883 family membrane-anchored ribosome-binding protein
MTPETGKEPIMAHSAQTMERDMMGRVKECTANVGETAKEVMQGAQQTAKDLGRKSQEKFASLNNAASEYIDQGRKKAKELGETIGSQIKEYPVSALLVAAGVGLLIGAVAMRRSNRPTA